MIHPLNAEGEPLTPIVLETNRGGMATYLCGCGALIISAMWYEHRHWCPTHIQVHPMNHDIDVDDAYPRNHE